MMGEFVNDVTSDGFLFEFHGQQLMTESGFLFCVQELSQVSAV
jgi:hypothetical protein